MTNLINNIGSNYAIIEKDDEVFIGTGKIHHLNSLDELQRLKSETRKKIVFITPFCLARSEKGHDAIGEEAIIAMEVESEMLTTREEILSILPDGEVSHGDIKTDISDEDLGDLVIKATDEIKNGNINQVILSRKFFADLSVDNDTILNIYSALLKGRGQYMTYLFNTQSETFIGASPEKHLLIERDNVEMNPIAGTFPKGDLNDFYKRLLEFLGNGKEIGELAMVIDEELKMISKITTGGIIDGPLLKDVGAVIHSEVNLRGKLKDNMSFLDAFRQTLYAPTLVGGPIESAFSEIEKFENESRGYYGGAFGVLGDDLLDTAIVIRTAFIDKINSILSVRAGAGIVEDSDSAKEANETIAKSDGFFKALRRGSSNNVSYLDKLSDEQKEQVEGLLETRKNMLSRFYTDSHIDENLEVEKIKGKKFILINNGDDFVFLSGFMIEKMGGVVDIVDNSDFDMSQVNNYDTVLLGPGYGDINDTNDPKMIKLLSVAQELIQSGKSILGICLGHQAICKSKGYEVKAQKEISQGKQKAVGVNGATQYLGFYNSFSPVVIGDNEGIEVFDDDRVLNYKGANISSTQSHPESIMSINGFEILKEMILDVI